MAPNDDREHDTPELTDEEVEEIVGGLGGTVDPSGTVRKPRLRRGIVEYGSGVIDYGTSAGVNYGSTP